MPKIPHHWTLKRQWKDKDEFTRVVKFINDYGKKEKFGIRWFTYFYAGEYKYWTMDTDYRVTTLINRAKI